MISLAGYDCGKHLIIRTAREKMAALWQKKKSGRTAIVAPSMRLLTLLLCTITVYPC